MIRKTAAKDSELSMGTGFPFTSKTRGRVHEFYLVGAIEPADEYIEWFDTIRNAHEEDIVKIYINSPGGDMLTALQFLRVLADSPAEIICSIEGGCMSAATIIFLAGDSMEISPNSMFMIHNYSGGTWGKGNEQHDQIIFERIWADKLFREIYAGFLTNEEITCMLDGKDYWLGSEDVITRATAYARLREEKYETASEKLEKEQIVP